MDLEGLVAKFSWLKYYILKRDCKNSRPVGNVRTPSKMQDDKVGKKHGHRTSEITGSRQRLSGAI